MICWCVLWWLNRCFGEMIWGFTTQDGSLFSLFVRANPQEPHTLRGAYSILQFFALLSFPCFSSCQLAIFSLYSRVEFPGASLKLSLSPLAQTHGLDRFGASETLLVSEMDSARKLPEIGGVSQSNQGARGSKPTAGGP